MMTEEIPEGSMIGISEQGKQVLIANVGGAYYAINNICTHNGCKLPTGILVGEIVTYRCHGSQFNIRTGEVVRGPARKPEPVWNVTMRDGKWIIGI